MKKVRVKKEYGVWYYRKITPKDDWTLDGNVYELYDKDMILVHIFAFYQDMIYFCETGIDLE